MSPRWIEQPGAERKFAAPIRHQDAIRIACSAASARMAGEELVTREPTMSEPIVLEMYTDYV